MEKVELIQIIQKSKDGDMEAMEKLLLHAHTSVSYQCRKMLKSEQDVEDMTQEILVTVYQKLDSLQEPAAFNQWLKKITAARCINALTRTHVEYQFAEDEEGHSILDTLEEMDEKKIPDQWLDNKETTRMIEDIVNSLPEAQRLCTLMFYYSEMSVKEMAHVLKVSENTVKSRLNYARKAIKEKVLDYEKQGIKLYGISPLPFLFYFLHKLEKESKNPAVAQVMVDEILAESSIVAAAGVAAAGSAGAAATGTAAATAVGVSGTAAATASGGLLAMLSAIPLKVVAGVTAAAVTVGGIAAATTIANKEQYETPVATIVQETQLESERNDDFTIIPEATGAEDDFVSDAEEGIPEETVEDEPSTSNGDTTTDSSGSNSAGIGSSGNNSSSDEGDTNTDSEDAYPTQSTEPELDPTEPTDSTTEPDPTEHTHQYSVNDTQEANCTEQGYTEYICSGCGNTYRDSETAALGHAYSDTVVDPTPTEQGYTEHICQRCGDTYKDNYTDPLGYSNVVSSGNTFNALIADDTTSVVFTNIAPPSEGTTDISAAKDGSVVAWYEGTKMYVSSANGEPISIGANCFGLFEDKSAITSIDFTNLDTSNVTNMKWMFYGCSSLTSLDLSSFDTSNVTDMESMFSDCSNLTSLDLGSFNTSKVTDMRLMFYGCSNLRTLNVSSFNTSNVTDMAYMFWGCSSLTNLDISNFNTSKVTDMHYMFGGCNSLSSLDLRNFNVSSVTNMDLMFYPCRSLTTIYAGDWTTEATAVTTSRDMFDGCSALSGAVAYNSGATDISMANPTTGYFTGNSQADYHLHSYKDTVIDPDCTDGGYIYHECESCGDSYISDNMEALGHSYQSTVVDPTETEQGYTEYVCSVCGDNYRDSYTDMAVVE